MCFVDAVLLQDCNGQTPIHFAAIDGTNISMREMHRLQVIPKKFG